MPAVGIIAFAARQFLHHQASRDLPIGRQQDARRQLFGLREIAFEGLGHRIGIQIDQALITHAIAAADGDVLDGDREHRPLAECAWAERLGQWFRIVGQSAQGSVAGAFCEQRTQRASAAQLHAQATIDLGVAGHQSGRGEGFAQACRDGRRVVRAFAHCGPGIRQPHQNAAHPGCLQQEAQQGVVGGGRD